MGLLVLEEPMFVRRALDAVNAHPSILPPHVQAASPTLGSTRGLTHAQLAPTEHPALEEPMFAQLALDAVNALQIILPLVAQAASPTMASTLR